MVTNVTKRAAADEINEVEGEGTKSKSAAGHWPQRFSLTEILTPRTSFIRTFKKVKQQGMSRAL
ncbi:hypothetical protein KIN20_019643 [Parelaphostrongylus tenuis]|uniref:Uncharacterized protein n=1 Tax=Parelaphostrongylus tenuis TaxID=148309 RepID=A0AAD5MLC3_PARTN|nr:hypothetical protein KIN20_019643 [Parelaphostrongylus tenuis]